MSYDDVGFTFCKYCTKPIRWAQKNSKWIPKALNGDRHECRIADPNRKEKRMKLEPHQKLNRTPIHAENEDQILKILQDKPLV